MNSFFVLYVRYTLYMERIIFIGDINFLGTMNEQYPSHNSEISTTNHERDLVLKNATDFYNDAIEQGNLEGIDGALAYYENAIKYSRILIESTSHDIVID